MLVIGNRIKRILFNYSETAQSSLKCFQTGTLRKQVETLPEHAILSR